MKFSLIWLCLFGLAAAVPVPDDNSNTLTDVSQNHAAALDLSKAFAEELVQIVLKKDTNKLTAIVNAYADRVLVNFAKVSTVTGLDPVRLPDIKKELRAFLSVGSLSLTKGWLQGISSMHRSGDVIVSYDPDGANILRVVVPVAFGVMSANYDYCAKILYLGPCGGLEAKIKDLSLEFALEFDFNKYQATLEHFYITHSGHIGLSFSGHILFDWLLNLLTNVATAALHEVILLIIESDIRDPIIKVVEIINIAINSFLHPPVTTTTAAVTTTKPAKLLVEYMGR